MRHIKGERIVAAFARRGIALAVRPDGSATGVATRDAVVPQWLLDACTHGATDVFIDVYARDGQLWLYVTDGCGSSMESPLHIDAARLLALKLNHLANQLPLPKLGPAPDAHPHAVLDPLPSLEELRRKLHED